MEQRQRSEAFAHSGPGEPGPQWHRLIEHLQSVSKLSARSAEKWSGASLAALAGLWHDLGKYAPDWQAFLREAGADAPAADAEPDALSEGRHRGPDHSTAGAIHAMECLSSSPRAAQLISFAIAGHHAGLSDLHDLETRLKRPEKRRRCEMAREAADRAALDAVPVEFPAWLSAYQRPGVSEVEIRRAFEFLVRMTFSALVDADFLDTEAFAEQWSAGGRATTRRAWRPLADYEQPLESYLETLSSKESSPVNLQRRRVVAWCREAAAMPPGAFSLTVPTGGGKTLASLVFAIRHARLHGLDRVIFALPFLSIVDQTADVLRGVFKTEIGEPALVEHHSSIQPERHTRANRLASENWDAPLVVTTQVQLFESLLANRPAACRKLHNLANSVLILDEVQSLPVGLLDPILEVLQALRANYGTSLLLMTATQPGLHRRPLGPWPAPRPWLDPPPTEIVPQEEAATLFASLDRVRVEWPQDDHPREWADLARMVATETQVLVIVHRRDDARDLWTEVKQFAPGVVHLSALMCPAHRREVIARIKGALSSGSECRVVSTQLIEAGVDVDFPVVFRAMAGLESLAQSAGRCNREGRLPQRGRFVVYNAPTEPPGLLRHHRDIALVMLRGEPGLSLTSPATFRAYFDRLYSQQETDAQGIGAKRASLRFQETARTFRMIDDATTTVIVPWGRVGRQAIETFRHAGPSRERMRALQPFGVGVYPEALRELSSRGLVESLHDTAVCLISEEHYHPVFGLDLRPEDFQAHFA